MIGSGFAIILMLTLVVGMASYWGLTRVMSVLELNQAANNLSDNFITAEVAVSAYLLNNFDEGRPFQKAAREQAARCLEQSRKLVQKIQGHQFLVDAERKEPVIIRNGLQNYVSSFNEYCAAEIRKIDMEKSTVKQCLVLESSIEKGRFWIKEMQSRLENMETVFGGYMSRNSGDRWKQVNEGLIEFQTAYDEYFSRVENKNTLTEKAKAIKTEFDNYKGMILTYNEEVAHQDYLYKQMRADAGMIMKAKKALAEFLVDRMNEVKKISLIAIWGFLLAAMLIGSVYALVNTRRIVGRLTWIIRGITTGADQVASASGQVSSASQSLAEGSSEQAASLEETSSSLEEMASMTKQNADNASQADHLMKEANRVIGKANDSMKAMAASMEDISRVSGQTSKIIKTIDEIAFQTNLLALNAAVEAARAGEAGAGFAVVADEVKNLAMRSAEAAKNTADLIEGIVKKVADGSALVNKTNEGFAAVADSTGKVAELVAEIAAASNEQARGIEQVNTAVMDMDKVTQQNAANAEESASAAEEMNAQAEQMKVIVGDLVALVEGNGTRVKRGRSDTASVQKGLKRKRLSKMGERPVAKNEDICKGAEITPQQAIPMDDGDFKDF